MRNSSWRWIRVVLALVALAALAWALWSTWGHELMASLQNEARPVRFFGLVALLPAIGAPVTPLFVLAGATFGVGVGLIGSWIALALNLTLCYWLARSKLRPLVERLLERMSRRELPDFAEKDRNAVRFTLLVKLAPGLPSFAKNYMLGVAGVPFALYFAVSMLTAGAYAAALVVLGESLFVHDSRRAIIAVVLVGALAAGLWWWRRSRRSRREAGHASGGRPSLRST
jgi:uncharacterized membrane protein YdjX (TVP38/TMEM64 family)